MKPHPKCDSACLFQCTKGFTQFPECATSPPAQQEPVATLWQHGETGRTRITMPGDITDCDARWFKAADLYTSPPAQRTWVGLTDEKMADYLGDRYHSMTENELEFFRLGEALYGIKENT